jgi:REP element-mobilizing transposase RayT
MEYNGKNIKDWDLEDLKKEFTKGYEKGNHELNALNDLVNAKLLEILKYKEDKNRLAILNELPELLRAYKMRSKIKKYSSKMRMKISTLKCLYAIRNDKKANEKIDRKIQEMINKEVAKKQKQELKKK